MSFYERRILPRLIHAAMRQDRFTPYRRRVVSAADGRVLEIGAGSGLNLPFYPAVVTSIIGLDPSPRLLSRACEAHHSLTRTKAAASGAGSIQERATRRPAMFVEASAEAIPLDARSVDTVVTTWTLCSVADARATLREVRRVLTPSGRLLFVEHGLSPDAGVRRWQDRLTPVWKHVAGGCHLNRPIGRLIEDAGFRIEHVQTGYMDGPKTMTFMYEGAARLI